MRKIHHFVLAITALAIMAFATPASADEATDAWTAGQQAFARQDYMLALSHFEKARDMGQSGPAVHYNIGVCQYKLGDYAKAGRTFARLDAAYPKMRPLAQYNLGLVKLKLSQPQKAINHFRDSYYSSTDEPKLRAMSSTMLRRIIDETVPERTWLSTINVRSGFDDNATLQDEAALAAGVTADSPFIELAGTLRGPFNKRNGFRLDGGFFLLGYSDASEFNQTTVQLGGLYDWHRSGWGVQFGAHASTTSLGGNSYGSGTLLSTRLTRSLSTAGTLSLRYRYDDISAGDAIFAGVDGSRQRVELGYRWYSDGRSLNLSYTNETNDRLDPSVSPDRNQFRFKYRYAPENGWGFGLGAAIRNSEYGDVTASRDEDLKILSAEVLRTLSSGWQLFVQAAVYDNDSTDPVFSYTRNQVAIGAFKLF